MIVGVILAGGQSSRMGKDKATLSYQGRTFLSQSEYLLAKAGVDEVVSCGGDEPLSVEDPYFRGPVGGIRAIVEHYVAQQPSALLVIPVDMPELPLDYLTDLLKHGTEKQCSCCYQSKPLPIYIQWHRELPEHCAWVLENTNGSMRDLINRLDAQSIPSDIDTDVININTPDELRAMNQRNKEF